MMKWPLDVWTDQCEFRVIRCTKLQQELQLKLLIDKDGRFFGTDALLNFSNKYGNNNGLCGIQKNLFVNFVKVAGHHTYINYANEN